MANTTTRTVTFSILSPDTSLSCDCIKLRLEEYNTLLASDSDTIELSTENGKTIICQKQANEMEDYLDQAEILLRDVVQSGDISSLVVLHCLCDVAQVLDNLKLYDECRLIGGCALKLAEALGRRSLEFRQDQARTLERIAGLSVYQPHARTLFIQAISICEELVANDASHSNKHRLLLVLGHAGSSLSDYQWLERAVQLLTIALPPTIVDPAFRGAIYYNYGIVLHQLKQYSDALEAYHEAISIGRTLFNNNPARNNSYLAQALGNMGNVLTDLGRHGDAAVAYKEGLEVCTTMSVQDPFLYKKQMAEALYNYGRTLGKLNQVSEAAAVEKRAISLLRNLARTGNELPKLLCYTLDHYGSHCDPLGQHSEAILAYQESIHLRRVLAAADSEEEKRLIRTLHNITHSLLALDRHAEANAAANEALERNHGRAFGGCRHAPNFQLCFVCRRAM